MARLRRITFRLTDEEILALQTYSSTNSITKSKALRRLVESLGLEFSERGWTCERQNRMTTPTRPPI